MDRYGNQPPRLPVRSQRMDGRTRMLIVGGAVALVTWFAWPYVRGEPGTYFGQPYFRDRPDPWHREGMRLDPSQQADIEDRRGDPRGRGGDLAEQAGPPSWSGARYGEDGPETSGAPPRQESRDRPTGDPYGCPDGQFMFPEGCRYRRWKVCTGRGERLQCSAWRDGPAPGHRKGGG